MKSSEEWLMKGYGKNAGKNKKTVNYTFSVHHNILFKDSVIKLLKHVCRRPGLREGERLAYKSGVGTPHNGYQILKYS